MMRKVVRAQAKNKKTAKNETNKTALVIAFVIVVVLLLLLGGGMMTGTTLSGGKMGSGWLGGSGWMGGISWMWIPALLMLGLGVLLVWVLFGQKK